MHGRCHVHDVGVVATVLDSQFVVLESLAVAIKSTRIFVLNETVPIILRENFLDDGSVCGVRLKNAGVV